MPNVTSVWDFSPGETLTAAKLDDVNCGIHVFSGTATRDAAYGGSNERTLEEGEFCYLADSNTTQYYNGSAWVAIGGGLVYLTGATFTTATSVSLPDNTFTSTYRNYRLLLNVTAFTSDVDLTMRMRASGSDNTTSNYRTVGIGLNSLGTAANITANATSSFNMSEADISTGDYTLTLDVLSPQTTDDTNLVGQVTTYQKIPAGLYSVNYGLSFLASTQFDSLSFISSVASSMTGVYRVYGYVNS